MIRGKLTLTKLKSVVRKMKNKKGEMIDCLIIPIKENDLFYSKKGSVFLDIVAFENDKFKEWTHSVKQSVPSEKYKVMTADEKMKVPFLGNLEVITPTSEGSNKSDELPDDPEIENSEEAGGDDLPF